MFKILIACSAYPPFIKGGGEISTKLLAESLAHEGFGVYVATMGDADSYELVNGVHIFTLKHKNLYWSYRANGKSFLSKLTWHIINSNNELAANKVIKLAENIGVDHILTSTVEDISSAVWRKARSLNIKTTHVLRGYSLQCPRATMYKKGENCAVQCKSCKILTLPVKINSHFVTNVVGISQYVLNSHLDNGYFLKAKDHVIFNISGQNLEEKGEFEYEWNPQEKDQICIGFIGNILPTKGLENLFSALEKLPDLVSKFKVVIAGDGENDYIRSIKSRAEKISSNFEFLGHVPQSAFFEKIDWLIVPSVWNEPFGRIIPESFAYRRPVIAMRRGGISELVNEKTGFLYSDIGELTERLRQITKISYKFDFSGSSKFSSEEIVEKWKCIFKSE